MDRRYRNHERRTGRQLGLIFRSHVENCLKNIWDTTEVEPDSDGDYGFCIDEVPAWVAVREGRTTPSARVYAYVCVDVRRTLRLLAELNEVNAGSTLARAYWADGDVTVEASLPWQLLDQRALQHLMDEVATVVGQIAELIALVHGGRPLLDGLVAIADDEVA